MIKFMERTKSRDEEHVDERAYGFFSSVYGSNGWVYDWNPTKPSLRPTKTLKDEDGYGNPVCAYCGRLGLPIQDPNNYNFKGHCCVCKDAMDELEIKEEKRKLQEKFNDILQGIDEALPKINGEVIELLIQKRRDDEIKAMQSGFSEKPAWVKVI